MVLKCSFCVQRIWVPPFLGVVQGLFYGGLFTRVYERLRSIEEIIFFVNQFVREEDVVSVFQTQPLSKLKREQNDDGYLYQDYAFRELILAHEMAGL